MAAIRFDKAYILAAHNEVAQLRTRHKPRSKAVRRRLDAIRAIEQIRIRNAATFHGKWMTLSIRHAALRQAFEMREAQPLGRLLNALVVLRWFLFHNTPHCGCAPLLSQKSRREAFEHRIAFEAQKLAAGQRAAFVRASGCYSKQLQAALCQAPRHPHAHSDEIRHGR